MTESLSKASSLISVTEKYRYTLLQYYEEEIMGEAYFCALSNHFEEREKLTWLAKMERQAARSIESLLKKYKLVPKDTLVLRLEGERQAQQHRFLSWRNFMMHIITEYPKYIEEFRMLEGLAPKADLAALKILTQHEFVAMQFANQELAHEPDSLDPVKDYVVMLQ